MRVHVAKTLPTRVAADALVLLRWRDGATPSHPPRDPLAALVHEWIRRSRFSSRAGDVTIFPTWGRIDWPQVILAGLGTRREFHPGVLRRTMAAVARAASRHGISRLVVSLDLPWHALQLTASHGIHLATLGAQEGSYAFRRYLRSRAGRSACPAEVRFVVPGADAKHAAAARGALLTGDVINRTRDLANLPGNDAPPRVIAAYARDLARRSKLRCQVWGPRRLAAEGCRALLAVARGSHQEPCLITLRYPGRRAGLRPVVLVGKTITFDTGGVSIKPAKSMEWMKYDKCGGMTVLAVMELVGRLLRPEFPVIGILAAAENMPGGDATRPGDIVRSRSGSTIEIINTDAEGRLVLADALSVAQDFRPACIIDLATLTGAAVVAVGHVLAALMGNGHDLANRLQTVGQQTGDRLWPLPLLPDYAGMLSSPFADLKNTGDGTAGAIAGGMFLKHFVDERTPWAHVDLTTAWEERDQGHTAAGATLFGTALLCEWISGGAPGRRRT